MDYVLHGFGVFLGVLAGTGVTLLVGWIQRRRGESQQVRNLKFELDLNIGKVDRWLEELGRYRNAVNGDSLQNYAGYFDLGRFIYVTANNMFLSGLLYKYLDDEQIGKLQEIVAEFSPAWEQIINSQITWNKTLFVQSTAASTWTSQAKPVVVQQINLWQGKFEGHRAALGQIKRSLD